MNDLMIFENREFGQIRTIQLNDETYFVGKDIADALGYADAFGALKKHVTEDDKLVCQIDSAGQKRDATVINESGLYALIFGSKLESAKRFKHWVTSEVLPQIRKTGSYQKPMTPQEIMRVQLGMIDEHEERISHLENTMNLDYGQQQTLKNEVSKRVVSVLGGKKSNAYKEMSKKVFSECNHDIQDFFNVNSRNNIPRLKFESAINYAKSWEPSNNTRIAISDCNAQINLEGSVYGI